MDKLVYFVLVNYKGNEDTIDCVNSINEKITYNNYRILIIDNSPAYEYYESLVAKKLKKCELIKSEENKGFAAGCNIGICRALEDNADYIVLLNNDTIVNSEDLIQQLLMCFRNPSVGVAGGKILYYKNPSEYWYAAGFLTPIRLRAKNRKRISKICKTPFITGCLQMISKEAIYKVGLLNEEYFMCYEDADYCERIHAAGLETFYNPDAIISHKVSKSAPESSPLSIYCSNRARYIFINKFHKKNLVVRGVFWLEIYIKLLVYTGEKQVAIKRVIKSIQEINN